MAQDVFLPHLLFLELKATRKRITQRRGGRYKLETEIPGTYPAISHEIGICRLKQIVGAFRRGSL